MKKAVIIYYSYSGNTKKAAKVLKGELESLYQTEEISLKALDEPDSFFKQALRALFKKKAVIADDIGFDLSEYDLIALGTPVWAFGMAPALRTYLEKCSRLDKKAVLLFTTYGSGTGKDKCIKEMEALVKQKGAAKVNMFDIQQGKVRDAEFVKSIIEKILRNE